MPTNDIQKYNEPMNAVEKSKICDISRIGNPIDNSSIEIDQNNSISEHDTAIFLDSFNENFSFDFGDAENKQENAINEPDVILG